jgi:hypothetical protein
LCLETRYKWYEMKPFFNEHHPKQRFIIDIIQQNCTCLHYQIFRYCYHKTFCISNFGVGQEEDADVVSTCDDPVDITQFRGIKTNAEDDAKDEWKLVDVAEDSGTRLLTAAKLNYKPSHIGEEECRQILHLLKFADDTVRNSIRDALRPVVSQLQSAQAVVPLITLQADDDTYGGNRRSSDRIVHPLLNRSSIKRAKLSAFALQEDLSLTTQLRQTSSSKFTVPSASKYCLTTIRRHRKPGRTKLPTDRPSRTNNREGS